MGTNIQLLREQIDDIDEKLVTLLGERIGLVRKIGALKQSQSLHVMDPNRESLKMRALFEQSVELGIPPTFTAIVFRNIIEASKRLQSTSADGEGPLQTRHCVNCNLNSAGLLDPILKWRVCPICRQPLI